MRVRILFLVNCFILFQILIRFWYHNSLFRNDVMPHTKIIEQNAYNVSHIVNRNENLTVNQSTVDKLRVTHGHCVGLSFPIKLAQDDYWNPVDINRTSYVFSAYLVDSRKKLVLIGATTAKYSKVYCQFWMKTETSVRLIESWVSAKIRLIPEGHNRRFTAALFECKNVPFIPTHVSLVTKLCRKPLNLIKVQDASIPKQYLRNFTVCLSPLRLHDNRTHELVEWVELNEILGAEKIVIYNYSVSNNINTVLRYYSDRGLVDVIQWRLPVNEKTNSTPEAVNFDTFYFAQLAALEDCLFRSKHESRYIVDVDVDEFIIPHQPGVYRWSDMLKSLDKSTASYNIRHAWFSKDWGSINIDFENKKLVEELGLVTLQKNQRLSNIYTHWVRSKYIARTAVVDILMIHRIALGPSFVVVPPEVGLLHHYRIGAHEQNKRNKIRKAKDETVIQKYAQLLIKKVSNACKVITCQP